MAPNRRHRLLLLLIVTMMLTSGCSGVSSTSPGAGQSGPSAIALSDSGRTFTYHVTDRFSVLLDRTHYPVTTLTSTPTGIVGLITNGSINGPEDYPVMFEAVQPGECLLEARDFRVRIVVAP